MHLQSKTQVLQLACPVCSRADAVTCMQPEAAFSRQLRACSTRAIRQA